MEVTVIGIFGKTNAGKSTLANELAGQQMSIVSPLAGTTTDPVRKRMEILGIGPCVLIDTAGLDDESPLGAQRIERTMAAATQVDVALLVDHDHGRLCPGEERLVALLSELDVPLIHVSRDADTDRLAKRIADAVRSSKTAERSILDGRVREGSKVMLVCPIDGEAPAGRLILPQVMAIRDILDRSGAALVVQPSQLENDPSLLSGISLVVTDSQVFGRVAAAVPQEIPLTSFSMLLARSKGNFAEYVKGVDAIGSLSDGDRVLIMESCSHTSSCEDIGRVKLPALLRRRTGRDLEIEFAGGWDEPSRPAEEYALVIQCGGCVATSRQLRGRLHRFIAAGVPVTNYGMALAWLNGIYKRAIRPLAPQR